MTPKSQLRLVCHPPSWPEHTPLHADADRTQLWELVRDQDIHLVLREPALLELARRRDPDLLCFSELLLKSQRHEDWTMAVKAIAAIGTTDSLEKLVMIFATSLNNDDRLLIIDLVARSLTADFVRPFSIMVRDIAKPGTIDISGWTKAAIATLQDVCKRVSVDIHVDGHAAKTAGAQLDDIDASSIQQSQ
ncbi:MAG: hypothetical protein ACFFED_01870 [Candidatus Thorarchaeota archaeon]